MPARKSSRSRLPLVSLPSQSMFYKFTLATISAFCLAACTEPIHIRKEFESGIEKLGVIPIYPLYEDFRVGQVYLIDPCYKKAPDDSPEYVPFGVLVTNDIVDAMQTQRLQSKTMKQRFPCTTPGNFGSGPSYTQGDCTSRELQLVGFPSYSIVDVQNVTLSGSVLTWWGRILAGFGFKSSNSLVVDVDGVEIATLSTQEIAKGIDTVCSPPEKGVFNNIEEANKVLAFARKEMEWYDRMRHEVRKKNDSDAVSNDNGSFTNKNVDNVVQNDNNSNVKYCEDGKKKLLLMMPKKVFYLRSIKYIFSNEKLTAAALGAGPNSFVGSPQPSPAVNAQTSPQVPTIVNNYYSSPQNTNSSPQNINASPPGNAAVTQGKGEVSEADISKISERVSASIKDIMSQIQGNSNNQVSTTYARASGRGIEFVTVFERPMAFGFVPIYVEDEVNNGFQAFCDFSQKSVSSNEQKDQ